MNREKMDQMKCREHGEQNCRKKKPNIGEDGLIRHVEVSKQQTGFLKRKIEKER